MCLCVCVWLSVCVCITKLCLLYIDWTIGAPIIPAVYWLYMFEMGLYLHSVYATIFVEVIRRDFAIQLIHHTLTLSLLGYSHMIRYDAVMLYTLLCCTYCTLLYSTVPRLLYHTVLYSTVLYCNCTGLYSTLLYMYLTVPYYTLLYLTVHMYMYHAVLYCTLLYCAVLYLYCTLLYNTVLCCTLLYYTVPYCTVPYFTVQWRSQGGQGGHLPPPLFF